MAISRWAAPFVASAVAVAGVGFAGSPGVTAADDAPVVHFVIDVSGSMSGSRLTSAVEAIKYTATSLPDTTALGLRSYAGGCDQSSVDPLVPIGVANDAEIIAAADGLRAGGGTPTTAALGEGLADVAEFETTGSKRIVLLTDGDTGCGVSVCDYIAGLGDIAIDITLFTVGLQVSSGAAADLQCAAELTGGTYFPANDQSDLVKALTQAAGGRDLRYVALGDSYSSGEGAGAGNYFQWQEIRYQCTLVINGKVVAQVEGPRPLGGRYQCEPYSISRDIGCHRAPTAWSFDLARTASDIRDDVENAACSGATIGENLLYDWRENEQPQVDRLRELNATEQVDLVTFTIVGNDVGFGDIGRACFAGNGPVYTCRGAERGVDNKLKKIDLVEPIRQLHDAAPNATIAYVSYPQVVPATQAEVQNCPWLDAVERESLRSVVGKINLAQFQAVQAAKAEGIDAVFIDITDALKGNEICTANSHVVPIYGNPINSEQAHPDSVDRSSSGDSSGQQDMSQAVFQGLIDAGVING